MHNSDIRNVLAIIAMFLAIAGVAVVFVFGRNKRPKLGYDDEDEVIVPTQRKNESLVYGIDEVVVEKRPHRESSQSKSTAGYAKKFRLLQNERLVSTLMQGFLAKNTIELITFTSMDIYLTNKRLLIDHSGITSSDVQSVDLVKINSVQTTRNSIGLFFGIVMAILGAVLFLFGVSARHAIVVVAVAGAFLLVAGILTAIFYNPRLIHIQVPGVTSHVGRGGIFGRGRAVVDGIFFRIPAGLPVNRSSDFCNEVFDAIDAARHEDKAEQANAIKVALQEARYQSGPDYVSAKVEENPRDDVEARLIKIRKLFEKGLLTREEYEEKKAALIEQI